MFNELAGSAAVFLFIIDAGAGVNCGERRGGSIWCRNHVVYHPESGDDFASRLQWDQRRIGLRDDDEELAWRAGGDFLELPDVGGAEDFEMRDERHHRLTAQLHLMGPRGGLPDTEDLVASIQIH
jgi:hypothetical protein